MRDDLSDLIARIEAANEGSRELDAEIAASQGWCLHPRTEYEAAQSDTGFTCLDCGADSWGNLSRNGLGQRLRDEPPRYTRSLDSALTLVPEGWTFGVNTFAPNEVFNPGGAQAYVMRADALGKSDAGGYHHAEAATPALALVAAALRARSMT